MTANRELWRVALTYAFLTVFLALILLPIAGIFLSAFKTQPEVIRGPFALPETWSLRNFRLAWEMGRFGDYLRNSVIVVIPVVVASVIFSTLNGYALGTLRVPGGRAIFFMLLIGIMIPLEAVVIPLYHLMSRLDLINSYWALILPQIGLSMSFGTFWMTAFFRATPGELIDAALIDGANSWQILWQVLWPLARAAVLTLIVLFFMWTWNEFLLALILVQDENVRTLPVALAFFQGRFTTDIPRLAAASLIVAAPILLVYALFQRYFIRGMTSGALKG